MGEIQKLQKIIFVIDCGVLPTIDAQVVLVTLDAT